MITQAIQLHFNSDMHRSSIEKEHLKQISPFQKEHEAGKQYENEVLIKVFMSIYWLAKVEISRTNFFSLLNLMDRAALQTLKHFNNSEESTLQEMFLILGQAVKDRVTERVNKSTFFSCLVDEVTGVSVLQQFVTFAKYVHESHAIACGLLTKTWNHKFIGAIYNMDAVLPPLAIHRKAFQFGELSFDTIPSAISACIAKLEKLRARRMISLPS